MRILFPIALSLALVTPVLAKPSADPHHPSTNVTAAPSGLQGTMGMMQDMMRCPMVGRSEGTLAFLKTELKITPDQAPAWDMFAKAYRHIAASQISIMGGGMMGMRGGDSEGAKMTKPLPDRMAMHMQMMEQHLAAAKKIQSAVQQLYAALDAKQKQTADELLPMLTMRHLM